MTKKKSPDFEPLPFEIDEQVDDSLLTPHAGVPLTIELFRAGGAVAARGGAVAARVGKDLETPGLASTMQSAE